MMTSSTLVETVSIDYEDFTEGFLTCSTCLYTYDQGEHTPKLLSCSHTLCQGCLEKIANQPGVTDSFRCPICRENILLPHEGVSSLPGSFVVNQLLDLVSKQRREVVPKCSTHIQQQLLFCETCNCVFCSLCNQGSHQSSHNSQHTVIPFSIAIKRLSEILLYKVEYCIKKLNEAHENVSSEIRKLDENAETTFEDINHAFQEIINVVDKRRQELLNYAHKMRDEKRTVLEEQLNQITNEHNKLESERTNLHHMVDVRNINKKTDDLDGKIEFASTLNEPKENCFIRFENIQNLSADYLSKVINEYGNIRSSKTFPSLCEVSLDKCAANLRSVARIITYEYTGHVQEHGGDPVSAELKHVQTNSVVPTNIIDKRDGTYEAHFVPPLPGKYHLSIYIFGRPIRTSPLEFETAAHINPLCVYGCQGNDINQFLQPVCLAISKRTKFIYVLDTGNHRIKVLSQNDCSNSPFKFVQHFTGNGLENGASTGMALKPVDENKFDSSNDQDEHLLITNWRSKLITEINAKTGELIQQFTHHELVEPTLLAINNQQEAIIVDNGAQSLFIFRKDCKLRLKIDANSFNTLNNITNTISSNRPRRISQTNVNTHFDTIGAIALDNLDNIIVASTRILVFSSDNGNLLRMFDHMDTSYTNKSIFGIQNSSSTNKDFNQSNQQLSTIKNESNQSKHFKGIYSGLTYDNKGFLLAIRMEKTRNCIQIFDYESCKFKYIIDSTDARLKRATSLVTTDDYHVIVVDLGNDCIKKYRYY